MPKNHIVLLWLMISLAGCNFASLPQGEVSPTIESIELTQVNDATIPPPTMTMTEAIITSPSPIVATQTAYLYRWPTHATTTTYRNAGTI